MGRFLTGLGQRWLIRYQYNIILTPIFSLGAILGALALLSFLRKRGYLSLSGKVIPLISLFLLTVPVIQTLRTNAPFVRILDPRSYVYDNRFDINYRLLAMIPKDPVVSVMAKSTFVPHLSHRFEIYRYEGWVIDKKKPQFVLMSADEGSDPPYGREIKLEIISDLSKKPNYDVLYFDGVRLLMKRRF